MKNTKSTKFWLFLLICILISLSVWGIFYVDVIDSKISIFGIVAVVVAAFTSVLTVNINNQKIRDREYEFHVLKEKQKVCEHFYSAYFEMLNNTRQGKKGLTKRVLDEMMLFKKGLMNWGSENLIKKYLEFDSTIINSEGDVKSLLINGNKFFLELRKELGFEDSGKVNIMSVILTAEAREEILNY